MSWSYSYAAGAGLGSTAVVQEWAVAGLPVRPGMRSECLGGGPSSWGRPAGGSSPDCDVVDQVLARHGAALWGWMLNDPVVFASVNAIKEAVLSDGVQVTPAVLPKVGQSGRKSDPEADLARDVADFCRYNVERLEDPFDRTVFELLDALPYGCELAEQVCEVASAGPHKGELVLKGLRVKPRASYALVVDAFGRVVAAQGQVPYWAGAGLDGRPHDPDAGQIVVIPRRKFALLQWNTAEGDPRGRSILRPAYVWWDIKAKLLPFYMRYLEQFATPSLIGTTAENAQAREARDADGVILPGQMVDPAKDLFDQIVNYQGGSALVVPFGTEVEPLEIRGDGSQFAEAIDTCDRQMATAIIHSPRATMEARHGSRADSQTGQDVMGLVIRRGKQAVCGMVRNDVLRPLVREKYGEEVAARLTPKVTCGVAERHDLPAMISAYSNLGRAGMVDRRIIPQIYADLGIGQLPDDDFQPVLLLGQAGPGGGPSTPGKPAAGPDGKPEPEPAARS